MRLGILAIDRPGAAGGAGDPHIPIAAAAPSHEIKTITEAAPRDAEQPYAAIQTTGDVQEHGKPYVPMVSRRCILQRLALDESTEGAKMRRRSREESQRTERLVM